MSQFLPSLIDQLLPTTREYGIKRVFSILCEGSLLIFPFVLWAIIYEYLAKGLFVFLWTQIPLIPIAMVIGEIVFLIFIVLVSYLSISTEMDSAAQIMQKMQDTAIGEQERKLVATCYLSLPILALLVKLRRKYFFTSCIVLTFFAFSLMAIVSIVGRNAADALIPIRDALQQTVHFSQATTPILAFFVLGLAVMSFYGWFELTSEAAAFLKATQVRPILTRPFSAFVNTIFPSYATHLLGSSFAYLENYLSSNRIFTARCIPFPKSLNVAKVAERSFDNIGRESIIRKYKCKITLKDAQSLLSEEKKHFEAAVIAHNIMNSNPNDASVIVNKSRPILYAGYVEDNCLFVGTILCSLSKGVQVGTFLFRNRYVKNEFQAILAKGIERARDI
jgi:hypothetical protein